MKKPDKARMSYKYDEEYVAYPATISNHNNSKWMFDTGATSHMSGNDNYFLNFRPYNGVLRLGNDNKINVYHPMK